MEKKIKLIHRDGPFGDCTSVYDVEFPQDITVAEFIQLVVDENPHEWGSFSLGWKQPTVACYSHGSITYTEAYDTYKLAKIASVSSNGGWSLMDYSLKLVPKPKAEVVVDIFKSLTNFPF